MKLNKTILVGFLFIALGGFVFISDILNPIIRPITYTFLTGSSKGKDIMFFALMGILLILSQIIPRKIDVTKYLKISIVIGSVLLILGNLLEVVFRLQMGIKLNTVFCSMTNTMSSTRILHTHLLKSILGEVITKRKGFNLSFYFNKTDFKSYNIDYFDKIKVRNLRDLGDVVIGYLINSTEKYETYKNVFDNLIADNFLNLKINK